MNKNFFAMALLLCLPVFAKLYDANVLFKSGVSFSNGMYYCAALKLYVRPYDNRPDVQACAYATKAKEICLKNPHTSWRSGRCFCPQLNEYLGVDQRQGDKIIRIGMDDDDAQGLLFGLKEEVKICKEFMPREHAFGRSVYLLSNDGFFVAKKSREHFDWDNRDDIPGEQGDPNFGPTIASALSLPLGFGYLNRSPIIPTFETLIQNLASLKSDVGFFESPGALSGQQYLEHFIANELPIALIGKKKDATYFLHDMNFHVMGFMLMPKDVRQLAQRQTSYLLDFIDDFSFRYPEKYALPQFRLLMQKLIESQIEQLDLATGNFTQKLFLLTENEQTLHEILRKLANMNVKERLALHSLIMALTDLESGRCERRSVKDFLEVRKGDYPLGLDADALEDIRFYQQAMDDYLERKMHEPELTEELAIDKYEDLEADDGKGRSAVELLGERILWLNKQKPRGCTLL